MPASRPVRAVKPSRSRARSGAANTCRTSPRERAGDQRCGAPGQGGPQRAGHVGAHLLLPLAGSAILQVLAFRGARDVIAWFVAALVPQT
jgi:hypothetical protein